ncbi:MAG: LacI family DNA-binding transcriptional regulator [Natronohydrobacter sp.]|nr:LacI family DNA-binding transcriptional regulator [Natronohydrobacter sp.]
MSNQRKPTLIDIARESGASLATVSRALAQPELVKADTLERIRSVAKRLGYVPNRKARALASGQSHTIGVVVPTLHSPIFSACLQDMQRSFAAAGYQLLIASHEYDMANEAAALTQLLSHGVDGLIVVGAARPPATWEMIEGAGIPLVQIWEGQAHLDCVRVDNHRAGFLVAQHLLDLGHRHIGVICGHLKNNDRQSARLDGIRAALAQTGLSLVRSQISEQPVSIGAGRTGCTTLLQLVPRLTAIIGTADLLAIGAMVEAQGRGFVIPADLSIAGIDNVDFAAHLAPSLSTVDIPAEAIGTEAAALMLLRLSPPGTGTVETRELPISLVTRHSTGPCMP